MSKFIDNIAVINSNVFNLTPLLVSFYKNLKRKEKDILLAYFVFPIVLNKKCLEELIKIKTTSRLTRITMNKGFMSGVQENFEYYKQITNNCLQYAIDCKYIKIEEDLSVRVTIKDTLLISDPSLNESMQLASQLYKIFNLDVLNTYLAFGIKRI